MRLKFRYVLHGEEDFFLNVLPIGTMSSSHGYGQSRLQEMDGLQWRRDVTAGGSKAKDLEKYLEFIEDKIYHAELLNTQMVNENTFQDQSVQPADTPRELQSAPLPLDKMGVPVVARSLFRCTVLIFVVLFKCLQASRWRKWSHGRKVGNW